MNPRERFRGSLLGLAVGDAVGTTVEFSGAIGDGGSGLGLTKAGAGKKIVLALATDQAAASQFTARLTAQIGVTHRFSIIENTRASQGDME